MRRWRRKDSGGAEAGEAASRSSPVAPRGNIVRSGFEWTRRALDRDATDVSQGPTGNREEDGRPPVLRPDGPVHFALTRDVPHRGAAGVFGAPAFDLVADANLPLKVHRVRVPDDS